MKTDWVKIIAIAALLLSLSSNNLSQVTKTDSATANQIGKCVQGTFSSSRDPVPLGWKGPIFRLSQNYPYTSPPDNYSWKNIKYQEDPMGYLMAVRQYVFEGNVDPRNPHASWLIQNNRRRRWYHAPWLHWGDNGREFVNGLTRELASVPGQIWKDPPQNAYIQNWAAGFYNAPGGYVLGRVWCNPQQPYLGPVKFPDGTVAAKLLFTAAPLDQVPFLKGSVMWVANINTVPTDAKSPRSPQLVRLLQIDVAVRDLRNTKTGWVFGTFIYNPAGGHRNPWQNMQPIGLMWGNDPQATPSNGKPIVESWLNPGVKHLMRHYGWAERLNGPVDSPVSSCLSCHSTAGWPRELPDGPVTLTPPSGASDTERLFWFRNIEAGAPFRVGQASHDYSLQLSYGIRQFMRAHSQSLAPQPGVVPKMIDRPSTVINRAGKPENEFWIETLLELKKRKPN